jgi:dienelactone hydrolase
MNRLGIALLSLGFLTLVTAASAQDRVKPKAAKGGKAFGEPWAEAPALYKKVKIPEWPVPTDLKKWGKDRLQVRQTLLKCMGELPARPDPRKVVSTFKYAHDDYTIEHFEFFNGVDQTVSGVLLIPKGVKKPMPAVILAHGHSGSKENLCINEKNSQCVGPTLAKKGYVVAAIDSYFCGGRTGKGPAGMIDAKPPSEEFSLFKYHLLMGRSLWGMMVRDQQCLIDYLETRPEVDAKRIGVSGMSMGCTTSWWLAAVDERIQSVVGVACFTRYTELIAHGNLRAHGIYYFVPGVLAHYDTEAIHALIAPRPHLELSGDQDAGAPLDGVVMLEKKLGQVYRLYDQGSNFRSIVYEKTGHEYLPEMREEMARWFEKTLPVK